MRCKLGVRSKLRVCAAARNTRRRARASHVVTRRCTLNLARAHAWARCVRDARTSTEASDAACDSSVIDAARARIISTESCGDTPGMLLAAPSSCVPTSAIILLTRDRTCAGSCGARVAIRAGPTSWKLAKCRVPGVPALRHAHAMRRNRLLVSDVSGEASWVPSSLQPGP